MKVYTEEQKKYIMSKIPDMKWDNISDVLRDFWINYRNLQP